MGVIPLAVSTGASSGSKHAIGTGVVGGMITATILAIFYIPLFYMLIAGFFSRRNKKSSDKTEAEQS
ncbi:hypothetical protein BFD44_24475 [Escherichia coli]|nr:hypothetical protein BFD44_24475 [Escherichia coli]